MKTMEKFEFVNKKMMLNMDDQAVIQLTCSKHAVPVLIELLGKLKNLGDIGGSSSVLIEKFKDPLFFDGDGSDHIYALTLNGRSLDEWVAKQQKRNDDLKASMVDIVKTHQPEESPDMDVEEAELQAEISDRLAASEADALVEMTCSHPNMHNIYPSGADQPGDRPSGQRCPDCGHTVWF